MGGIYSINIITMPRLNCVTPLIKDEIEGTVNLWHSVYYTYACYRGNKLLALLLFDFTMET